jgi:hypothetical protein
MDFDNLLTIIVPEASGTSTDFGAGKTFLAVVFSGKYIAIQLFIVGV